jgi:hypothetical protein
MLTISTFINATLVIFFSLSLYITINFKVNLEKEASILAVFEQIIRREQGINDIDYRRDEPNVKVVREYLHSNFLKRVTLDQLE